MGCCLGKGSRDSEVELSGEVTNEALTCKLGARSDSIKVSAGENGFNITGSGLALGSCPLDCDTARWEVVVQRLDSSVEATQAVQIGVKRYNPKIKTNLNSSLQESEEEKESPGWLLKGVEVKEGDVIGVYWDQTDLPMLSFTRNGQLISQASINRIRPSSEIFPAVSLQGNSAATVVFDDAGFRFPPLSSKFKMIICSSSII